jgi:hypothetical protein
MANIPPTPASLRHAAAQLADEGVSLEKKLNDLRTFVRIAHQYGAHYKRDVIDDIRKLSNKLKWAENACISLRMKGTATGSL